MVVFQWTFLLIDLLDKKNLLLVKRDFLVGRKTPCPEEFLLSLGEAWSRLLRNPNAGLYSRDNLRSFAVNSPKINSPAAIMDKINQLIEAENQVDAKSKLASFVKEDEFWIKLCFDLNARLDSGDENYVLPAR